jgi:selenocysteine-specific elongation factor
MYIVGTAGHVDHGKSSLIEAITGTHPDRLREEREREMSIVLGFASFALPDGRGISVVDVPGHRDFIENMLSGIGSIDACLLVIAADEGVMPQTREHLAILDLLEVHKGVVVLTKIDLVDDPDWLDLVEAEIEEIIAPTALAGSPIVRVSARTKSGLPELLEALGQVLEDQPPRLDLERPRLSVDRVFLMPGFGAVVTGTLLDGTFRVGDELEVLPGGKSGRIRGLQNHSQEVEGISPGNRAAVNISGIEGKAIKRGDVLAHPGTYQATRRLDVAFRYLAGIDKPLTHNMECKLFLGADETLARVRLLGQEKLQPGETGWLQLEVEDPLVAVRGDRFILRRPSPSETLGGGTVVDPRPPRRHKRFDGKVLERLEALSGGDPRDVLIQAISRSGESGWNEILAVSGLDEGTAVKILADLIAADLVLEVGKKTKRVILLKGSWESILDDIRGRVGAYHQAFPLRPGMPLEELKNQAKYGETVFREAVNNLLEAGELIQEGPSIRRSDFTLQFTKDQQARVDELMARFDANPALPPSVADCRGAVGEDIYSALLALGQLQQLSPEVVFTPGTYREMVDRVTSRIATQGPITVAEARDLLGSSRKYVLALLERLDAEGVTVREGDLRRLK